MSVGEQSLADFQAVLERHRNNENAYKERLKEMNLTRGKIAEQLEALQQTYDRKLRGLEQKLEGLRGQNEALLRENTLYRSEIETYQSRLLEKEKIIAALLAQRRELPVVASSDKSKSEKTDSLNANEEDTKAFKKQPLFKEDYEQQPVSAPEKLKQEPAAGPLPAQRADRQAEKPQHHEVKLPPQKRVAVPVLPQEISNHEVVPPLPKHIEQAFQPEVVSLPPAPARSKPSKGKPNKKAPPAPFKASYRNTAEEDAPVDANNFFSSLGRQEAAEAEVEDAHWPPQANAAQASQQFEQEEITPTAQLEPEGEAAHYQDEEGINHASYTPGVQEEQEQTEPQQFHEQPECNHEQPESHHEQPSKEEEHQAPQEQAFSDEPQEEQGNFLSHFNRPQTEAENYYAPYPHKKKANKKRSKPAAGREEAGVEAGEGEGEGTGSDFFAQLSRAEHEPHQLDNIEESSIDHIDRDNSLLSNEQPYFAVEAPLAKRAVKMSKKKKREIKMMDPSCFD